ncbi:hypothetical protein [Sediminibacterium sp. C3]|uniref:hypothetical protein n=1 Tax=Sediminibacterium sp. C3 TaxID=1267211 RepID=UPI0004087865|nr:hypothetical protein [Sediminibacterium sp. C3]
MIVINRNNYESYFLLYVDRELSSEENEAVERFVAENPDIAEELTLLQNTLLQPEETLVFKGKEVLLKKEGQDISLNNYEEWFLLYTDNELSDEHKTQVELFVLQHPTLQREFEWLQQTRLPVEKLVFSNKEILYKKETSGKSPVFYMRWMRYAAAAAVIGIMATVWMLAPTNTLKAPLEVGGAEPELVGTSDKSTGQGESTGQGSNGNTVDQRFGKQEDGASYSTVKIINADNQAVKASNKMNQGQVATSVVANNNPIIKMVETVPARNQGEALTVNSSVSNQPNTSVPLVNTEKVVPVMAAVEKPLIAESPEEKAEAAPEESKPVYTALDDSDEDKSLYIGALEINKDRLRGLFRKAGNIFRSRAKQNEEDGRPRK